MRKIIHGARSRALSVMCGVLVVTTLGGCFFAQQLHGKLDEDALLRAGALDPRPVERYTTYSFNFLGAYRVSHDWPETASPCRYKNIWRVPSSGGTPVPVRVGDIEERDGRAVQQHQDESINAAKEMRWLSIEDRMSSRVVINPVDGKPVETGLRPMCFETWAETSHVLTVKFFRRSADEWRDMLARANPNGTFSNELIKGNHWLVQRTPITFNERKVLGGAYQSWTLPIADTGYTITIQLGANSSSLKDAERHSQMERILKHLVESVSVERF